jgi:2'-5' RNA ligase
MPETAIAALFPELDPLLSGWLRRYTPSGARGLGPHVTLNVPFADSFLVGEHLAQLAAELARFAAFDVVLRSAARFPGTLYLEPEPAEPFVAMTEALGRAFPDFPPYEGEFDEIVPHLTIAQGEDSLLDAIEAELAEQLPLVTRVERVWLVENTPSGWRRHTAFALERHKSV